jgi:hypothetical protein
MQAQYALWKSTHAAPEQLELYNNLDKALQNYVALGGNIEDVTERFYAQSDSGNALIVPAGDYLPGTDTVLARQRGKWLADLGDASSDIGGLAAPGLAGKVSAQTLRGLIANGNWVYVPGARGYAIADPESGRIMTRILEVNEVPRGGGKVSVMDYVGR